MDVIEMRNRLYDTVLKIGWDAMQKGEDPTREDFEEAFKKVLDWWFEGEADG